MNIINALKSRFLKHPEEERVIETIEEIMDEREERGDETLVDSHEILLLKNIFRLRDVRAHQIMIPRIDILAVSDAISRADLESLMLRDQFTRIPVYSKTMDNIIGVLHVKDYLAAILRADEIDLNKIINKSILFVPASTRALNLLREMQLKKMQMAVVVDEYGATDGLITLEDLLEVVVGEIEDEHDALDQTQMIQQLNDSILANAKASLSDIEHLIGPFVDREKLPEDIDTIGGYVFHLAGRLPHKDESISHPTGIRFKITDVDARRIKQIKISHYRDFQKKLEQEQKKKK